MGIGVVPLQTSVMLGMIADFSRHMAATHLSIIGQHQHIWEPIN